ncbi:MAG: hypothetical protein ACYTAN_12635 [Planctomycetota bacterium]|jgi:hypothetical protein
MGEGSFRLSQTMRSFHLVRDPGTVFPARARRVVQWLLLLAQIFIAPCLCSQGLVNVFVLAVLGLILDLLIYDRSAGLKRPIDWLFAAFRTAFAAAVLLRW